MVFYVVVCHGLLRNGPLFECVCACLCLMWMCLCVCVESLQRPEASCQVRVVRFYVSLISFSSTSSSSSSLPHGVIMSEEMPEKIVTKNVRRDGNCYHLRSTAISRGQGFLPDLNRDFVGASVPCQTLNTSSASFPAWPQPQQKIGQIERQKDRQKVCDKECEKTC